MQNFVRIVEKELINISMETKKLFCPNCGKEIKESYKFCKYCGFEVKECTLSDNNYLGQGTQDLEDLKNDIEVNAKPYKKGEILKCSNCGHTGTPGININNELYCKYCKNVFSNIYTNDEYIYYIESNLKKRRIIGIICRIIFYITLTIIILDSVIYSFVAREYLWLVLKLIFFPATFLIWPWVSGLWWLWIISMACYMISTFYGKLRPVG